MEGPAGVEMEKPKMATSQKPLKLCILGPPGVGKSTVARQISDMYKLNHFTKEDMISSTIEMLRGIAGDEAALEEDEASSNYDDGQLPKELLAEVDIVLGGEQSEDHGESQTNLARRKSLSHLSDEIICKLYRYRLLTDQCQNQGFILDGFPNTEEEARLLFLAGDDLNEYYGEELGEDGKDMLDPRLVPDKIVLLEASDEFLNQRLLTIPTAQLQDRHQNKVFPGVLQQYRKQMENYDNTSQHYFDLQEMIYYPIDVSGDNGDLPNVVLRVADLLGPPPGLTPEQENALKNGQAGSKNSLDQEAFDEMETKEMRERRNNIQQWMEKLAKIKREEFEREEAALMPLRHYLMAHVVPTLTKGLIEVTRVRPFDPVEFLAEFMFQNNPGSINNTNAQTFREEMVKKKRQPRPFTHK